MLRTNIELDEKLVDEAMKLTHKKTKKELVNYALSELVSRIKHQVFFQVDGLAGAGDPLDVEPGCKLLLGSVRPLTRSDDGIVTGLSDCLGQIRRLDRGRVVANGDLDGITIELRVFDTALALQQLDDGGTAALAGDVLE